MVGLWVDLETVIVSDGKLWGRALRGHRKVRLGTSSVEGDEGPAQGGWERQAPSCATV